MWHRLKWSDTFKNDVPGRGKGLPGRADRNTSPSATRLEGDISRGPGFVAFCLGSFKAALPRSTMRGITYFSPKKLLIVFPTSRKFKIFSRGTSLTRPFRTPASRFTLISAMIVKRYKDGAPYHNVVRRADSDSKLRSRVNACY